MKSLPGFPLRHGSSLNLVTLNLVTLWAAWSIVADAVADPPPDVRITGEGGPAGSPNPGARIAGWIRQLGDSDFQKRQTAEAHLAQAGPEALEPLQQALRSADPEIRVRARRIIPALRTALATREYFDSVARLGSIGVAVLDNCDPRYEPPLPRSDGLRLISATGKHHFLRRNLNNCEAIGANHGVVIDAERQRVLYREYVSGTVTALDIATSKTIFQVGQKCCALALDPGNGNVWCLDGKANVVVIDPTGERLATHAVKAFDIAFSPADDAFWMVGRDVTKMDRNGTVLSRKQISDWFCVSVAPDPVTGGAWVVERNHSEGNGRNQLHRFAPDGTLAQSIALGVLPFSVACDAEGTAWVVRMRKEIELFQRDGTRLPAIPVPAVSIAISPRTGDVWVATKEDVLRIDSEGKTLTRATLGRLSSQTWLAAF